MIESNVRMTEVAATSPTKTGRECREPVGVRNVRAELARLLARDLDFHEQPSNHTSHSIHAFAAKFPPQLPRLFIEALTSVGDLVLDPMVGSGTTLVEALAIGRRAIGTDLDPLATKLCKVKTTQLDRREAERAVQMTVREAWQLAAQTSVVDELRTRLFDRETREFVDYWFLPRTQRQLAALREGISRISDDAPRSFLELVFSSIIITKSGGVSRARDLAHSRPHLDAAKQPKSAIDQFANRGAKILGAILDLPEGETQTLVSQADTRRLPIRTASVDLIVTSPPYANAIDYMRAHKFSLVWQGKGIGHLSDLRGKYIGSERAGHLSTGDVPELARSAVEAVARRDGQKARVLLRYFVEMKQAIEEMHRVLRPGRAAVIVVGPSVMRGYAVATHECLGEIASSVGFAWVGTARRELDRNRRMMPARASGVARSGIEQRMHEEFVLGLVK